MQTTPRRTQPDIRAIARLIPPSGNLVQGQSEIAIHPELARAINDVIGAGLNHYSFFEGVDEVAELSWWRAFFHVAVWDCGERISRRNASEKRNPDGKFT